MKTEEFTMGYTVIAAGKMKEKFYLSACEEYLKRLNLYGGCRILEIPEFRLQAEPSPGEILQGLQREAEEISGKIPKGAYLIICTPEGKELSSPELAKKIADVKEKGKSEICFLIGSSNGLDRSLKERADLKLSMGPMTFPHHLFRVMLLEQIYRAENILSGGRYHK